ncbi:hypothetical protein [Actinomycetospora sp. CA-053990]|uniref:hypothetical protein n=1 Tax=Actinomycetospora sp. CA-053990 TaxID=3239891 RepID=UPI003D8CD385
MSRLKSPEDQKRKGWAEVNMNAAERARANELVRRVGKGKATVVRLAILDLCDEYGIPADMAAVVTEKSA